MTTVATFSKPEEAHLFCHRLEGAGIPAFVQDERTIQMDWLISNAIGGVRVQIADADVEAAREFLAADVPQSCPEAEDVPCPACGSVQTAPDELPRRLAFLTLLVLTFPLPLIRRRWRCAACNKVFKVPKAD
jgi:Putative prokaryotic signal transducing protein